MSSGSDVRDECYIGRELFHSHVLYLKRVEEGDFLHFESCCFGLSFFCFLVLLVLLFFI
jgi:hypothetical protein